MDKKKLGILILLFLPLFFATGLLFSENKVFAEEGQEDAAIQSTTGKETTIPSAETKALPSFNWRLLDNDGINLNTFTKVPVNTPARLTGGIFSAAQTNRNYFMYFGHVGQGSFYNQETGEFSNIKGDLLAPLGSEKRLLPLLNPVLIGVKKGTTGKQQVFGYDFSYTNTTSNYASSSFDIGELDGSGQVALSGSVTKANDKTTYGNEVIMEQYIKDNEIVAYGFFRQIPTASTTGTASTFVPVRVHGHVVDFNKGRVRYDVNFYNDSYVQKKYAVTHASHMDVGGNHKNTKLFSYGEGGIYFDEEEKTIADGLPARIFFYTNIGYNDSGTYPTDILTGNLKDIYDNRPGPVTETGEKIGYWKYIAKSGFTTPLEGYTNPYQTWDTPLPIYTQYNLTHPIFALRWPVISVAAKDVGTASLDLSIEEPKRLKPTTMKTYKNLTTNSTQNFIDNILSFEVSASNEGDLTTWANITLEDRLPSELELDLDSLILVYVNGKETKLPPSVYDENTHSFKMGGLNLAPKERVKIRYKAKIISDKKTEIINTFRAYNTDGDEDESIVKIPIKQEAKLKGEKTYSNDTSIDGNHVGDTLSFELSTSNSGSVVAQDIIWKDIYPKELEIDKNSFVLVDSEGKEKNITPMITQASNSIRILDVLDIPIGKQIKVRYKAKIIDGENTTVTNTFTAIDINNKSIEGQVDIKIDPEKPLTKDLTIKFIDKAGRKLHEPITMTKNLDEIVKLKELAETVGSDLYNAIEKVKSNQYELVEKPADEVKIVEGENVVSYIFDGQLMLHSAPETIDFDIHKYNGKVTRVNNPLYDQDLVVKDGRLSKEQWTLTAKLTDEMRSTNPASKNVVLKNAIRYVSGGKEVVLDQTARLIMKHTNEENQELYNISSTWSGTQDGDGLKLEVDPGDVKKLGQYQGEILWELAATPVN